MALSGTVRALAERTVEPEVEESEVAVDPTSYGRKKRPRHYADPLKGPVTSDQAWEQRMADEASLLEEKEKSETRKESTIERRRAERVKYIEDLPLAEDSLLKKDNIIGKLTMPLISALIFKLSGAVNGKSKPELIEEYTKLANKTQLALEHIPEIQQPQLEITQ